MLCRGRLRRRAAVWVTVGLLAFLAGPRAAATNEEVVVICRQPSLAIPDASANGVVDTISISSDMTLVSATIGMTITHGWVGDLTVTLSKVGEGPMITLLDRLGVWEGSAYGCGAYALAAQFSDDAAIAATESCVAGEVAGTLRPALPLAHVAGRSLGGVWQLKVSDRATGWTGSLERWCLRAVAAPAPRLQVTPPGVDAWVAPGAMRTTNVTLSNSGGADWLWGMVPAAAGGELLLAEDFEGDSVPPAGWQRLTNFPAGSWQLSGGTGHAATQAALVPYSDAPLDEWLIRSPLWLQRGWLSLWTSGSASDCQGSTECELEVYLMGEAIGTVLLGRADEAWLADGAWAAHSWELTPYLPATSSVQVGIRYVTAGYSPAVRLDDVQISGLALPPGCHAPQAEWLRVESSAAPLSPGAQAALTLTLDAGNLQASAYHSTACLAGNDPLQPLWPLPVALYVDGCAAVSPPTPTLSIHEGAGGSAVLAWEAEPGQASYRIYRGDRPYAETPWLELGGGSEAAVDPAPGRAAFYRLEAGNCSGELWASSNRAGWMSFNLSHE